MYNTNVSFNVILRRIIALYGNESLRKENIEAVFYAVADNKCATRAEISKITGISVVTVGKAVEEFLDRDVFIQRASQKKTVGRHANRVVLNKAKQFAVIDITNRNFKATFFDLALNIIYRYYYDYLDDFDYADNLCSFLNKLKAYMLYNQKNSYFANYFILPGIYDKKNDTVLNCGNYELENMHLQAYIQKRTVMTMNKTIDNTTAAVRHFQILCPKGENILYISLTDKSIIKARIIIDGKVLKMPIMSERKVDCDNIHSSIANFIADVCTVVEISQVYMEGNKRLFEPDFDKIRAIWNENQLVNYINIPKLKFNYDIEFSHLGCAKILRRSWLDNLIR